jgi:hypothetical protein
MAFSVLLPGAPPRAPALSARCPQSRADPPGMPLDEADAVQVNPRLDAGADQ